MQRNKQPIPEDSYNNFKEIDKSNKGIVINTLIAEHNRAEKLANEVLKVNNELKEVIASCNTTAPDSELADNAKKRLETTLASVQSKLSKINLKDAEKYFKPKLTSVHEEALRNDSNEHEESSQAKAGHKSYKLDSNTKTFTGAPGERLSQWLFIIDEAFTAQGVAEDKIKLALITNYVKGSALNALMRYQKEVNPTWIGFQKMLKNQYEDSNLDYRIRTQFFNLKMENSFPKYLSKFQELLNQIPSMSENDIEVVFKFTDGLSKEYAFAVRRDKCETLSHAIEVCQDLDCLSRSHGKNESALNEIENVNKVRRVNFAKMQNKVAYGKNPRPGFSNYRLNKKPFQKQEFYSSKTKETYKGKGQPSLNKNKWNKNTNSVSNQNITCYKCKRQGHMANKCFLKQKKVYSVNLHENILECNNNLLTTNGSINGMPIQFTLDTAASVCIMSEKIASENNFKILDSDVHVKLM